MTDYTNWTDADEIALLRGRVAENSSLQARIVELQRALDRTSVAFTAERALADDLRRWQAEAAWVLERYADDWKTFNPLEVYERNERRLDLLARYRETQ